MAIDDDDESRTEGRVGHDADNIRKHHAEGGKYRQSSTKDLNVWSYGTYLYLMAARKSL
jgi:hypothetical protein